jgi:hypothetical protein
MEYSPNVAKLQKISNENISKQIFDKKYFLLISFSVRTFFESSKNISESFKNIPKRSGALAPCFALASSVMIPVRVRHPQNF